LSRALNQLGIVSFAVILIGFTLERLGVISVFLFDLVFALAIGGTALGFAGRMRCDRLRAAILVFAFIGSAIAIRLIDGDIRLAPYLAVLLINGFVAFVFARGLLPGRVPLILQVIRLVESGPEGSPAFQRFVYGQCRLWTGFGLLTALAGCVAMVSPTLRGSAETLLTGLIVLQVCWFVLSHLYANRRYGRPETWHETLRAFSRPTVWSGLEI
jgi:hypothetical protein